MLVCGLLNPHVQGVSSESIRRCRLGS